MLDWKTLCQTLAVDSLVPEEFAAYRPPIIDGLSFFLENLSPSRQAAILADQAALPMAATTDVRLVAVARHCPVLQKLGQVLARERRFPSDFRRSLQELESVEPTISGQVAREIVESELGDLADLGITIEDQPLAEASMAVVIPFVWQDRSCDHTRHGVFKLLKPNIQKYLEEELRLLQQVGAFLDEQCEHYGIPNIDYGGLFAQVRELLNNEVDLSREQEHMAEARRAFADVPNIVIPELFSFCTPRITAMERIVGQKVTEFSQASTTQRRRLASTIVEALIARPIWSAGSVTMFHADPHAGNLLVTNDHQLAIIDWGLVGTLTKRDLISVSQILMGAMTLDSRRIVRSISSLADNQFDQRELKSTLR